MIKTKLIAALLGGAILCASLLTGCGPSIKLKESGGKCITSSGDTVYLHASTCYVPVSQGDKYGTLEVSSHLSLSLHEIPGMDPNEWLATEDGYVLYAENVTLPSLSDMQPSAVHIYKNSGTIPSKSAEITDKTQISALVTACETKTNVSLSSSATYVVRFKSDLYPGILYSLHYVEQGGSYYLYDRFTGSVYSVDDAIRRALDGTAETETETAVM